MPSAEAVDAIVHARHGDPFAVLGQHAEGGALVVNAFVPGAERVVVFDAATGDEAGPLALVHGDGFFSGAMPERDAPFPYRLRAERGGDAWEIVDPYMFGRVLGELDEHLIAEGTHLRAYERLGAHLREVDGVAGVAFAVWAPNAGRVSVVGSFNAWDGRRNPMRRTAAGVWELFLPDAREGDGYKYELLGPGGEALPLKADPYAFACEPAPGTASIVAAAGGPAWTDAAWMAGREARQRRDAPVTIYEVHLGSWKRGAGDATLTYRELATDLVPYAAGLGFTHIELLPVAEHPFYGSWGYQTIGMFAPASRYGSPADFAAFVDAAHAAGLGVILDWVPGHFPTDAHGLGRFDGTHLYEHADPRQGFQPDWNTLVFNFDRSEVVNYLVSNALFWLETYHIDGLRVDAVASMLYLDFSRAADAWVPNEFGGRENLGAIRFLRRVNDVVHAEVAGAVTMAEESSDWPGVSAPVAAGGLGFDYKWNMGWMHDSLDYMALDPLYRGWDQNRLTFSFMYAYTERFVLPLSHDEVVYGKRSLLDKMPGDEWQRFANLRAYYGFMWAHPGKKLLFMGGEFAQEREWNHDRSLDWHLFADPRHAGVQTLVGDLNRTLRALPSLHELDMKQAGLEFLRSDRENCVVAFVRRDRAGGTTVLVTNFTPVVRRNYRFGIPDGPDAFVEAINTDAVRYGGGGVHNDVLYAERYGMDGKPRSLNMTLPPLATVILKPM